MLEILSQPKNNKHANRSVEYSCLNQCYIFDLPAVQGSNFYQRAIWRISGAIIAFTCRNFLHITGYFSGQRCRHFGWTSGGTGKTFKEPNYSSSPYPFTQRYFAVYRYSFFYFISIMPWESSFICPHC